MKEEVFIISKESIKLIANNKKAYHDYFIDDKWEAGIELFGTEVKSIRMGKCSIKEAFVKIDKGEVYVYGMHISPYEKGNIFNKDPLRVRKLLLHKCEIMKLNGKIAEKGSRHFPTGRCAGNHTGNVYYGAYVFIQNCHSDIRTSKIPYVCRIFTTFSKSIFRFCAACVYWRIRILCSNCLGVGGYSSRCNDTLL